MTRGGSDKDFSLIWGEEKVTQASFGGTFKRKDTREQADVKGNSFQNFEAMTGK